MATDPKTDAAAVLRNLLKHEPGIFTTAERDALRAVLTERDQLRPEYGLRITYTSTLTEEGAVAETLGDALAALDQLDAAQRPDVVSRMIIQRPVGQWHEIGDGRA